MEGRIWTVKDRACLDTVAQYVLKHKAAFDIPRGSAGDQDIHDAGGEDKIPDKLGRDGMKSVVVPGDGTCLIHAFLFCTLGTMRTLRSEDRKKMGQMFRTLLYHEHRDAPEFTVNGRRRFTRKVSDWIREEGLVFLINKFRVNACIIESGGEHGESYRFYQHFENAPYIIIFNRTQTHFTPVNVGGDYLFTGNMINDFRPMLKSRTIPYVVHRSEDEQPEFFNLASDEPRQLSGLSAAGLDSDFGSDYSVDELLREGLAGGTRRRRRTRRSIRRKTRNKR
jgi:hypothetical protein